MKRFMLIVCVAVVIALAVWVYVHRSSTYENDVGGSGVVCTMEAKLCPDGSAVGRTGPRCEFAPCPGQ